MKLSAFIAQTGPQLIELYAASTGLPPAATEELRPMLDTFVDAMQAKEHEGERIDRARFISHLAADIMRGWPGEPSRDAARQCVELAHLIASESYRACKEPF